MLKKQMDGATLRGITLSLLLALLIPCTSRAAEISDAQVLVESARYKEAWGILLPMANNGSDEAQRIVGEMCYLGQGVKKNFEAARKWTELSASSGNPTAQYNLGYLYERGEGVKQSTNSAMEWYKKSASQNYVPAQRKLGDIYASSNEENALYWYDQARQLGDDEARKKFSALSSRNIAMKNDHDKKQKLEEEERQARIRREEEADRERERRARESEDDQSVSEYYAAIGEQIRQRGAEDAALLDRVNRQTTAAYAETNRRLAEQAAERRRSREELEERAAERRREELREREARIARVDDERRRDEDRAREAELRRQREADNQQVAKQEGAHEPVPKCAYYLNENAFPPGLTTEKREVARRAAAENNAWLRDHGVPPCEVNKPTGPSRNSSK